MFLESLNKVSDLGGVRRCAAWACKADALPTELTAPHVNVTSIYVTPGLLSSLDWDAWDRTTSAFALTPVVILNATTHPLLHLEMLLWSE